MTQNSLMYLSFSTRQSPCNPVFSTLLFCTASFFSTTRLSLTFSNFMTVNKILFNFVPLFLQSTLDPSLVWRNTRGMKRHFSQKQCNVERDLTRESDCESLLVKTLEVKMPLQEHAKWNIPCTVFFGRHSRLHTHSDTFLSSQRNFVATQNNYSHTSCIKCCYFSWRKDISRVRERERGYIFFSTLFQSLSSLLLSFAFKVFCFPSSFPCSCHSLHFCALQCVLQ